MPLSRWSPIPVLVSSLLLSLAVSLVLSIALRSAPVLAADPPEEGLVLAAGQWIFDVQVQMLMQAKPTTQSVHTCATNEPITPDQLMPWAESRGCKIGSVKVRKNELSWKLRCNHNGQRSRGGGKFSAKGDRGEGRATVSFEMGGRQLSVVTLWDARRVGVCAADSAGPLAPPVPDATEAADSPQ